VECPYCGEELRYQDEYFKGRLESFSGTAGCGLYYPSTKVHLGDIYKCKNEECEAYEQHFYTDTQDNLKEGYPC
jgi:hypothetical protein